MKRFSQKAKITNARHARNSGRRKVAWQKWRRRKNGGTVHYTAMITDRGQRVRVRVATQGVRCPSNFCLDENPDEVITFLAELRARLAKMTDRTPTQRRAMRRTPRHIEGFTDFSTIRRITPAAALILAAEFDRVRRITGSRMPAINRRNWNPDVERRLDELGFLSLLDTDDRRAAPQPGELRIITPFRSGEANAPRDAGQMTETMTNLLRDAGVDPDAVEHEIYTGLLEAMENTRQHAYPENAQPEYRTLPLWWMTGEVDIAERKITIAVYDHGVSIPATLPTWDLYSRVVRWFRLAIRRVPGADEVELDGRFIRAAMAVGRTSTGLHHRGKGLGRLREIVTQARAGKLRIISRCGEVWYVPGQRPKEVTRSHSIGGTLIELELAI